MHGRENEVARVRRRHGGLDGLRIAHFAQENYIRVFTESGAHRFGEGIGINTNLALCDNGALFGKEKFDWVLDGDDVLAAREIDAVDERGECRGFTASGGAGQQYQTPLQLS